tara:strand:+ start:1010 stop:1492 length:483 start_codon:yes stop_codon:yes gene_type:complete
MSYKFNSILKNSKYLVTSHSSVQATSASAATFVTLSGSEISYTPSENSTKVIYEISFYSEKQGNPFVAAYLQHYVSGSWSEIHNKYRKNWGLGGSTSQMNRWPIYWRFVLPSWTGERSLRIRLGQEAANRQINLHQVTDWDGAGSITDKFSNTNLLVYSI